MLGFGLHLMFLGFHMLAILGGCFGLFITIPLHVICTAAIK